MKKKLSLLIAALVLAATLVLPTATPSMAHTEASPAQFYLYAGQTLIVGGVNVWNDAGTLYVESRIWVIGWLLKSTAVHVATSLDGIPHSNGGPKVGKFDYSDPHGLVTEYRYAIPLTWAAGTTLYIAAHADVVGPCGGEETAWGGCESFPFPGKNWATYLTYVVQ